MATYTDRIVLVFPIAAKNRQAAASLQTLEITDAGKEFETLVPLDPALVSEYASQFNLPLLERVTELEADLATANATISTLTSEKTSLTAQVESLTSQLETKLESIADLQGEVEGLESERNQLNRYITALQAQVTTLSEEKADLLTQVYSLEGQLEQAETEITFLNSIRTYDPNQIRSLAFYDRISKDQINKLGLLAIDDPQAAEIHKLLNAYKNNPWPVLLDDPLVVGGIQYLLHIEIITQQEAAQITRPASREEAYIA